MNKNAFCYHCGSIQKYYVREKPYYHPVLKRSYIEKAGYCPICFREVYVSELRLENQRKSSDLINRNSEKEFWRFYREHNNKLLAYLKRILK